MVCELKEVDWKELGIQLNVPQHVLSDIDRDNHSEARKRSAVLQYWIDNEPAASWEKITKVLQRIGGHENIITNIRTNYTFSQPSHQVTSYCPPDVPTSPVAEASARHVIDSVLSLVDQLIRFPADLQECPCADSHLIELSKYVVSNAECKELSCFLHLSRKEVEGIMKQVAKATARDVHVPELKSGAKEILKMWRDKFENDANYR